MLMYYFYFSASFPLLSFLTTLLSSPPSLLIFSRLLSSPPPPLLPFSQLWSSKTRLQLHICSLVTSLYSRNDSERRKDVTLSSLCSLSLSPPLHFPFSPFSYLFFSFRFFLLPLLFVLSLNLFHCLFFLLLFTPPPLYVRVGRVGREEEEKKTSVAPTSLSAPAPPLNQTPPADKQRTPLIIRGRRRKREKRVKGGGIK